MDLDYPINLALLFFAGFFLPFSAFLDKGSSKTPKYFTQNHVENIAENTCHLFLDFCLFCRVLGVSP
jgi:hypothetical protein